MYWYELVFPQALSTMNTFLLAALAVPVLAALYFWINDAKLTRLPSEVAHISPERWSDETTRECYASMRNGPSSLLEGNLPPSTGRRYIVVGGVSASSTMRRHVL